MTRAKILLAALAASCASSQPAEIAYRTGGRRASPPPPPPIERRAPELAPDWAAAEGTPLSAFALQPEDAYDPANPPRSHRVRAGETLYDIAERYQAPLLALIGQNGLEPPYAVSEGRVIELPPPRFHTVARGESFEDIATRHDIDPRSLALLNRMQPPYRVAPGQRLLLPALAARHEPAAAPAPQASSSARTSSTPQATGSVRFAWPIGGEIVSRFGMQPGGARMDGVEIAGREGGAVKAAADGEVVYAGADLPAYGVLVLVRHADNYVTAYGYARRALVREGDSVRAGQTIAELGRRPNGGARLLFQIRRGAEAIDPAPLLGSRD